MKETTFHLREHLLFALLTVLTLILCIGVGSVSVPFRDTAEIIFRAIAGWEQPSGSAVAIILYTRLPRVLCVALVGAMLALGGCAMQGAAAQSAGGWFDAGREFGRVAWCGTRDSQRRVHPVPALRRHGGRGDALRVPFPRRPPCPRLRP